ncbi:unnamed protein product [Soboliphyme baturini]|uniref:Cullin domain-containing protein n=1 Tax=Soboliphyme baturini TaxID=241478 RepID=A0A183JA20_9BILA|nr:unnamed protein product [Soboliphyme baturini]
MHHVALHSRGRIAIDAVPLNTKGLWREGVENFLTRLVDRSVCISGKELIDVCVRSMKMDSGLSPSVFLGFVTCEGSRTLCAVMATDP